MGTLPEEARLSFCMRLKGLEAKETAKRTGLLQIETKSLLEQMTHKGVIYCVVVMLFLSGDIVSLVDKTSSCDLRPDGP